jgi:hypothetical protein
MSTAFLKNFAERGAKKGRQAIMFCLPEKNG